MSKKGLNSNEVKKRNRSKILRILRNGIEISRKDLSDQMGLTKAGISTIVSEMIEEGVIIETGSQENGGLGRNRVTLEINKNFGYVLGLSFTETHLTLLISNVLGQTIDLYTQDYSQLETVETESLLTLVIDKSLYLLWNNNIDKSSVLGFGIGYIGGLKNIDVKKIEIEIKKRLNIEVFSDNNVKALAMSQMDFTPQDKSDNFLFVKYGPGLGMAIVQNGSIINGFDKRAGEIGHTIIAPHLETSCRCGRKGCLESLISEKGIIKDLEEQGDSYLSLILDKSRSIIDYQQVNSLLEKEDPITLSIFQPRYEHFSKSLANSIILFNPEYVCVYGSIFNQSKIFSMISDSVDDYLGTNTNVKVILSNLDLNNSALGSVALALRYTFYNNGAFKETIDENLNSAPI
ncbi:MAG: ROK family transcriptional regulator [Clostridia bacterium]|nr:ROK family transcriptional regulator [Clostridia bacterium]